MSDLKSVIEVRDDGHHVVTTGPTACCFGSLDIAAEFIAMYQVAMLEAKAEVERLTARLAAAEAARDDAVEKQDTAETTLRTLQAGVARRVYGVLYEDVRPNELILVTVDKLIARLAAAEAERDEARRFLAAAHVALSEVAPCGHYNRFIEWEDHSKPIACVKCKLDAAEAAARDEVAEFNAGYDCAMGGGSVHDQPIECPYDVWEVGFAWAMWNKDKHT